MAERKPCSEPESATAEAPRPMVASATTRNVVSHFLFPGIWGDIDPRASVSLDVG